MTRAAAVKVIGQCHIGGFTIAVLLLLLAMPVTATVLTGTVRSDGAQGIFTPPSMSSPVVLRFYVADGTAVKKGDPLLRIDAGQAASQLRSLDEKIAQTEATTAKDVAKLKLAEIDAQLALVDAKAARDTAAVDAAIPKKLISALDYDRYQGTYKSTRRDAVLKAKELGAARAAVTQRQHDGALQAKKSRIQQAFFQSQVDTATVTASQDGVVIHSFQGSNPWGDGGRFEQGSTSFPGTEVGQVVAPQGGHSVRAWALQPDRRTLTVGQAVSLRFDALPGVTAGGHIRRISGAAQPKPEWGEGRYYVIDIGFDAGASKLPLLPGMSVRVQTGGSAQADVATTPTTPTTGVIKATGEVYAQQTVAIMPPQIPGLWQMSVTHMATDGAPIKKGQPAVVFAGGDLAQELPAKMSELAEKKRTQEQLRLQLADDARTAKLATAQARADADKAKRKAAQPEKYVPGIEYKKLVIDRHRTEQRLGLTKARETAAAAYRAAQQQLADLEVKQLQREVAEKQKSLASLTIPAPRDGVFLHNVMPNGDKVDTGSQIWRGMSVGDIPDMDSLAVQASLPERDLRRVHVGQTVRVTVSGGAGRTLDGHIANIGNSVHSKSRVEPVPVVDLRIALDDRNNALKPGQPVQVEIIARKSKS